MSQRVNIVGLSCVTFVALLSLIWAVLRWNAPALHIGHDRATVNVNVSTLGEYPTTVTRIRLSDLNRKTVLWEVEAKDGHAQIHGFSLHKGENTTEPRADFGGYTVLTPPESDTFTLSSGSEYEIEVWGERSFLGKSSAVFQMDDVR